MTGIHSALTASIPDLRPEVSFLPQPLLTIHLSQEREEEGGSEDIVTEVDNVLGKLMASLQKGEYCCSRCGGHCHCWLLLLLSWLCLRYTTIWSTCWPRCRKLTPRGMLSLYSCPSAYSNTQILMARARDGQSGLGVIYTFAQSSRAEPRITDVIPNKMGE